MIDTTATPSPEAVQLAADLNNALLSQHVMRHLRDRYGVEMIAGPESITLRKARNSIVLKGAITPQALRNGWEMIAKP